MKGELTVGEKKKGSVLPARTFWQRPAVQPVADHAVHAEPSSAMPGSRFTQDLSQVPTFSTRDMARPETVTQCPLAPTRCPFGGACHACPVGVQAKLKLSQPGDRYEQEAERAAEAIVGEAAAVPGRAPVASAGAAGRAAILQRQEGKPPSEEEKYKEAAKKVGEAFLETDVGKKMADKAKELGKEFLGTLAGKVITGAAATGAVVALAATNAELPMQVPEIPLDVLTPGLSMKLTYEGPVRNPTKAMLSFTYKFGGPEEKEKPKMTETEKQRAETAKLAADLARFRESLKTPEQRAAERSAWMETFMLLHGKDPLSLWNLPGLKKKEDVPALEPKKEEEIPLRKAADGPSLSPQAGAGVPAIVHEVLRSPGQPLDPATRAFMEPRFGCDFSQVRVHADAKAAESARAINAQAYTAGREVVFGLGRYAPESQAGRRLIAHELTHVLQQSTAPLEHRSMPVLQRSIDPQPGVTLDSFFQSKGVSNVRWSGFDYTHLGGTQLDLAAQILVDMLRSPRHFRVEGNTEELARTSLDQHVAARKGVIEFAGKKQYRFGAGSAFRMNPRYWVVDPAGGGFKVKEGVDPLTAIKDLNVTPSEYRIACFAATLLTMLGGSGETELAEDKTSDQSDWIPGEWGYVENTRFSGLRQDIGREGENIIYTGYGKFWGHISDTVTYLRLEEWVKKVESWNHGAAVRDNRRRPRKGLV